MEYIILDIETTGLDLNNSAIIEVAALLVNGNAIKQKFSSLVRYNGVLPETIKRITGITEDMLAVGNPLPEVIADLQNFIGKRPVVAHNGFSFDFPILERDGLKFNGKEKYDSIEFAFFVLPTSVNGHSTEALAQHFSMEEVAHRALNDCETTFEILRRLRSEYSKKPKKNREALNHLANYVGWWWSQFLAGDSVQVERISDLVPAHQAYRKTNVDQGMLGLGLKRIDLDEIKRYFSASEPLVDSDYCEKRPEQEKMALCIGNAFNEQRHAVIEAGTGIGKSKAYLVPSLLFALNNGIPVIISTHTKVLQDQLFNKEIPHLKETVNPDLVATLLKGKKNYVCLDKFDKFGDDLTQMLERSLYEFEKSGVQYTSRLAYLLLSSWVLETERGDWDEIPYWFKLKIPKLVEQKICNIDELCGPDICHLYDKKQCFLAKARLRAKDSDLVIVNNALTLSGIILKDETVNTIDSDELNDNTSATNQTKKFDHTVFPGEAKYIVFDEAHHLEEDATSAWEAVISDAGFKLLMEQLFENSRLRSIIGNIVAAKNNASVKSQAESFFNQKKDLSLAVLSLFKKILPELVPVNGPLGYSTHSMIDEIPASSTKEDFFTMMRDLRGRLAGISDSLNIFNPLANQEKDQKIISVYSRNVKRVIDSLDVFLSEDQGYARYLERSGEVVEIKAEPISVAEILDDRVYGNFKSVILTSATITVENIFNFFARRCGTILANKAKFKYYLLHSSFNYQEQVKFFVPKGINYKEDKEGHLEKCAAFLEKAIIASQGGALILCSSYDQVEELRKRLDSSLSKNNIWLIAQIKNSSVTTLIREFKKDMNSVLIGTQSLWQGIDVPGQSLRSLYIYKIPYPMPFRPIIKKRREAIDEKGGDSFVEYYEPMAALALKQGFGRLIRKRTDKGVAVLLDENLLNKPRLLKSFPDGVNPLREDQEIICAALSDLKMG
ncbi:MAG: helicase C-terminal domain-containing protein [Candidatus Gastranaerophilales bacterium]|nr:helicase C-terminal domain-containing protein [Candidatus Gastranaerophilales bacterium]